MFGKKLFSRNKKNYTSLIRATETLVFGNENAAIEEFSSMVKDNKNISIEYMLILSFLRRKVGDYTRAAQILEMILGENNMPKKFNDELKTEIAKNYMFAGQYAKASELIKSDSDLMKNPENVLTLAHCSFAVQNWDSAIAYYNKYKRLSNNTIYGFYEKCMLSKAMNMQTLEIAQVYIKEVMSINSQCRPARIMNAIIFLKTNKLSKAIDEFKDIIKEGLLRDINDFKYVEQAYIKAGKEGELIELLREESHKCNPNPIVHIALSDYYYNNNDEYTGKLVLETYIELPDMKIAAAKKYAERTKDKVTGNILKNTNNYKCTRCGYETNEYKDDCPQCSAFDSIYFI